MVELNFRNVLPELDYIQQGGLLGVHHTGFIVAEAGQIYRGCTNSDHGIDGEIEFKDDQGRASGKRLVAAEVTRLKSISDF